MSVIVQHKRQFNNTIKIVPKIFVATVYISVRWIRSQANLDLAVPRFTNNFVALCRWDGQLNKVISLLNENVEVCLFSSRAKDENVLVSIIVKIKVLSFHYSC